MFTLIRISFVLVIEPRISIKAELKSPPFPFRFPAPSQFPTTWILLV